MGLIPTLLILAGAIGFAAFARYMANRPREPGDPPRLINWNILMILAGVVAVLMVAHLFNLAGLETGRGRGGYLN